MNTHLTYNLKETFPKQTDGKLQNNIWNLIPRNQIQSEMLSSKHGMHWNMISAKMASLQNLSTMVTTPQTAIQNTGI
jgi:hypothetical protein